ncbi:NIN-like protein [Artemisia annua]|uniref:NIN-like protein n=1 Tax=Artemisia annua TaxID=35608 RepID=A0A2U1LX69_ARTAN|nr:NIN-like protein [Artemisia annua]
MVLNNDMSSNNISLEHPSDAFSGDARYMAPLWVSGKADELSQSDPSQSAITSCFEPTDGDMDPHNQIANDKIKAALKDSERNAYIVDKDHEEEELSPPARVFRRQLPEWTLDVANYSPKQFPQKESAIRCNLHGYLALPVLDTATRSCIGVLELLTYSKYPSFAYEVQQFEKALKTQDLTCLNISDGPASNVPFELGKNELDDIFSIMKVVCDIQNIPLAQTWAMSPLNTFYSHEQILRKRCDSFDTKCLGKVCMSTTALPFYVKDLGLWPFREACRKRHLDKSHSPVGRALLSGCSCFCEDVTKLSEEEYPLVHYARMNRLTSCFLISFHSVQTNDDYVLEFFLPSHMKSAKHLLNLVRMLKQNFEATSGFELGERSSIEVLGPSMDLGVNKEPDIFETSSYLMDNFSDVADVARTDYADVPDECSSTNASTTFTSRYLKQSRKRKRGSDTMVSVKVTYGEDIKWFLFPISLGPSMLKSEVAKSFGLKDEMIGLKYLDEDNDLILVCADNDLEDALVASGNENSMNLICKLSAP